MGVIGAAVGLAVGSTLPATLVTVTERSLSPWMAAGPMLREVSTTAEKAALAVEVGPPKLAALMPVNVCTRGMLICRMTREVGSAVGAETGRWDGWRDGWAVGWLVGRELG